MVTQNLNVIITFLLIVLNFCLSKLLFITIFCEILLFSEQFLMHFITQYFSIFSIQRLDFVILPFILYLSMVCTHISPWLISFVFIFLPRCRWDFTQVLISPRMFQNRFPQIAVLSCLASFYFPLISPLYR